MCKLIAPKKRISVSEKVQKGFEAGFQGNCRPAGLAQRGKRYKFNGRHNRGRRKNNRGRRKKVGATFLLEECQQFLPRPTPIRPTWISCGFVDRRTKCPEKLSFFAKLDFLLLPNWIFSDEEFLRCHCSIPARQKS